MRRGPYLPGVLVHMPCLSLRLAGGLLVRQISGELDCGEGSGFTAPGGFMGDQ